MKIVVVSDTHRDIDSLRIVRTMHMDADMFLHCGDSEVPSEYLDGFSSVKGNCDYFDYPISKRFKTPFGDIYMEHGDKPGICRDSYILSKNCLLFLHGHTHRHSVKKVGNCYVANPGSLTRPRDGSNGTYLVIELDQNGIRFNFKELY